MWLYQREFYFGPERVLRYKQHTTPFESIWQREDRKKKRNKQTEEHHWRETKGHPEKTQKAHDVQHTEEALQQN